MPLRPGATPKKNILVVDSERVTRLTFESILTRAGYRVVTAANVDEALQALQRMHFHAILADIVHGKGPALDLLTGMGSIGATIPLVVIDRDQDSESASACLSLGACRYLTKPVHTDELLQVMIQILN